MSGKAIVGRMGGPGLPAVTLTDRFLASVAPGFAMQRFRAKAAMQFLSGTGGYVGARTDRRPTKEWQPRAASANADQIPDLPSLRGRSRDLIRNTPIATGACNTHVRSTIGSGIRPHAQIDRELLGLTDEQADAWERQAERLFRMVADSTALDVTGRQTFAGLCDIVCRSEFESGDVFAIRRHKEMPGDLIGLKIQLLEADRVCNPQFLPDTERMAGGVELDDDGAPVKYWYANRHPQDLFQAGPLSWESIPARGPRTGEPQLLHVFRQERADQVRGVPKLGPVIEPLKQLDRFTEAELMAAVLNAFFTVFVKSEEGTESDMLEGQTSTQTTLAANELKLGSGAIVGLGKGESIEIADPKRPNEKFDPFFMAIIRQVAVAVEMPVEVLMMQFLSSYSAARASLQEAWRTFLTCRVRLTSQFAHPVYCWAIGEFVARGYLQAPGFFESPLLRAAWTNALWRGPTPSSLSPVDDAVAAEKWLAMGVKTLAETTAETTGADWERSHVQRVKEVKARRRDGLDVEPVAERIVTEPREPVPAEGAGPQRAPEPGSPAADRQQAAAQGEFGLAALERLDRSLRALADRPAPSAVAPAPAPHIEVHPPAITVNVAGQPKAIASELERDASGAVTGSRFVYAEAGT